MKQFKKPDFLPFKSLPLLTEQCIEAGRYILYLEVTEGPLNENQAFEILTGTHINPEKTTDEQRMVRQVYMAIGKNLPNFKNNNPAKVLGILERA